MEQAELERLRQQFDTEVRNRFPDAPIQRVEVLQYGDEPTIEPGQLLGRVTLDPPDVTGEGTEGTEGTEGAREGRMRRLEDFHTAHRDAIRGLRRDLDRLPAPPVLEFVVGGEPAEGERGPVIKLARAPRGLGGGEAPGLTPVMARLGQEDLETLDILITAGIAASRAEAVRWALARIRERPAYEQLRARAREIEELKAQF
jgi:hypothetical protein